ncbi:hypothetical protein [Methylicorpusculum sp.]|uniref:hypothetical protein n=1 Tax=Methylicorpusculum sp. TaxID=2713644 RepID=UPI002ABA6643|nr:hypothetical protein [Methylicorpusculum sp.]MDZ4150506.1 hypothetical protein [Methylicorpusculum sp.]
MQKLNLLMNGYIKADDLSALAVAPMKQDNEKTWWDRDKYGNEGDEKTARLPRMAKYFESLDGTAVNQCVFVPYFPASSIRGSIRRACRDALFELMQGQKWSLSMHRLLTIGGVSTSGEMKEVNINLIQEFRDKNPLVSLFGATAEPSHPWIEGRISIGHAMPDAPFKPTIVTGVRTDPVQRNPSEIVMLDEASAEALDKVCNAGRTMSRIKAKIEDLNKEIKVAKKSHAPASAIQEQQDQIAELTEKMNEASALFGTTVSIQMPLSGYEVIPPCLPLNQRIVARGVNLVELGLLVAGLRRFAKNPLLGAHHAHGCGVVRGEWDVTIGDFQGKVILEPFVDLVIEGDKLSDLFIKAEEHFKSTMDGCTEATLKPA